MTRLTRYIHHSGFWFCVGCVFTFLYLSRNYRVVKRQPVPDNVRDIREVRAS